MAQTGKMIASLLSENNNVSELAKKNLENIPEIHGILIGYEPDFLARLAAGEFPRYKLDNHDHFFKSEMIPETYCSARFRDSEGKIVVSNLSEIAYPIRNWYLLGKYLERGIWTDPYITQIVHTQVCSYVVPFTVEGTFAGVVCVAYRVSDLMKKWLSVELPRGLQSNSGFFLLADNGKILFHSRPDRWFSERMYSMVPKEREKELFPLINQILSDTTGSLKIEDWGSTFPGYHEPGNIWLLHSPVRNGTDWVLCATFDESEVMADIYYRLIVYWVGGLILFLFVCILTSIVIAKICGPVIVIANISRRIAEGDLDVRVPSRYIRGKSSVAALSANFNYMADRLAENIQKSVNEKIKIDAFEKELGVARQIQETLLPRRNYLKDSEYYDLDARLVPAHFVAGDFYDFWPVDDERIALLIADISGKGVPAAMIMATARTIIRQVSFARRDKLPGEIMTEVNEICRQSNDRQMFATAFFAICNVQTGKIQFCNAGHSPPVIVRADGVVKSLNNPTDTIIGIFPKIVYHSHETTLDRGETLLLYTDGVTDSRPIRGDYYGDKRFQEYLTRMGALPIGQMIDSILNELKSYSKGHLADDITLVALHRK